MSNLPRFLIETFFVFSLVVFIIYLKLSGKPDSEIFLNIKFIWNIFNKTDAII